MLNLDFSGSLTPTKTLQPQGLDTCCPFHFVSTLNSPHCTYLLLLTRHGPSLSSSDAWTLCSPVSLKMGTTISSRSLIPARLSILPRIILSLSTQFFSFCKFKPFPVSPNLWLSHFPYSQQSTLSIVLLHEKTKILRQELFQVYL